MNGSQLFRDRLESLLHRWFVRFNPLYFFSALCMLGGVLLVSSTTSPEARSRLLLSGVVQGYEFFLLGGAALLCRKLNLRRPAVILAIISLPFLCDWTFQTEAHATLGKEGIGASLCWILLLPVKLILLARIFQLRLPAFLLVGLTAASLFVAAFPHLLMNLPGYREPLFLAGVWIGAGGGVLLLRWKPVTCAAKLGEWGTLVFHRCRRVAAAMAAAFVVLHALSWATIFQLDLSPLHLIPLVFAFPFLVRHEATAWISTLVGAGITWAFPETQAPALAIAALLLGVHAWRFRNSRLIVLSIILLHLAVWFRHRTGAALPDPELWLSLASAAALSALGCWKGIRFSFVAAACLLLPHWELARPNTLQEGGIMAIVLAFVTLGGGIWVSWHMRKEDPPEEGRSAPFHDPMLDS